MATWPTDPSWIDPNDNINNGNQYENADGVTVSDFNNLIKDVIYLGNQPTPVSQLKNVTITENGTVSITPDTGYDVLSQVNVTTNIPLQTKSITVTENGTITITPDEGFAGITQLVITINVPTTSYSQFVTSDGENFITANDRNFKVKA